MSKVSPIKPVLIYLYGFPGSGKSYLGRNLAKELQAAYINTDRLRGQLFNRPRYDEHENATVDFLIKYLAKEFLGVGVSVIYDGDLSKLTQRREVRELARTEKAESLLIWLQIDADSAFTRTQQRDRRTTDDKYATVQTRQSFNSQIAKMQNPRDEDYIVISGKHAFATQRSSIINRLYQLGLVAGGSLQHKVAKPELVNLVPGIYTDQMDLSRRNIPIR